MCLLKRYNFFSDGVSGNNTSLKWLLCTRSSAKLTIRRILKKCKKLSRGESKNSGLTSKKRAAIKWPLIIFVTFIGFFCQKGRRRRFFSLERLHAFLRAGPVFYFSWQIWGWIQSGTKLSHRYSIITIDSNMSILSIQTVVK